MRFIICSIIYLLTFPIFMYGETALLVVNRLANRDDWLLEKGGQFGKCGDGEVMLPT